MKDLIDKIANIQKKYGEETPTPLSEEEIATFRSSFEEKYGIPAPGGFVTFLSFANGLDFNGYRIYSAIDNIIDEIPQGFFEINQLLNDFDEGELENSALNYIFFADSGLDRFVLHKPDKVFCSIDRVSYDVTESFGSAEEMIVYILEQMLAN